jgi:hypothetical protein
LGRCLNQGEWNPIPVASIPSQLWLQALQTMVLVVLHPALERSQANARPVAVRNVMLAARNGREQLLSPAATGLGDHFGKHTVAEQGDLFSSLLVIH